MMRLLTGATESGDPSFDFVPVTVLAFGPFVIAEGRYRSVSWVHAWTVTNGVITQVREYFNTSLTVTRLQASSSSSSHCFRRTLWESSCVSDSSGTSMPGLVLAI
ncbi:senescence associated gene 20-like [Aristolochia californica]|uniref:senescence associated gene 20-like n=1 Tax=Aristolochia californica TaxID=171875 RepID=UPI0035DBF9F3